MEKNAGMFSSIKHFHFFSTEERMSWTSWMSKLSAKVFFFFSPKSELL